MVSASVSDSSLDLSLSESELKSDASEGRGDEDGTSAGKDFGTCEIDENDIAGAKSTSVKTRGLNG